MKAFISYSHNDEVALERLHIHLAMLKRDGLVETWFDRNILAGGEFDSAISDQLESSDLFLLLVSPDFLASNYCYEKEMARALERHDASEARVIPIIIEPCDWKSARSPLRKLKAVPHDGNPVSEWTNANNAYLDVVSELRRLLEVDSEATESEIKAETAAPNRPEAQRNSRYRVKRDFDEIDRSEFRKKAFKTIRDYFRRSISEIDEIDGLRGQFSEISTSAFGGTIVNKSRDRSTAHITVHQRSGNAVFGDISYSFSENAPANTSNGSFNVEADEYELYLAGMMFSFGGEDTRFTLEDAAERLWTDFLKQAGIDYD